MGKLSENAQAAIALGKDLIHHRVSENFADEHKNEQALRDMFVEANGGSTKIEYRNFRRNPELFEIIEILIPDMVETGLKGDEYFMKLVELIIGNDGDSFKFYAKPKTYLYVSDISYGNGGIKRQRIDSGREVEVETKLKGIRVYDDLERFMAEKITLDELVTAVTTAMKRRILQDIYTAYANISEETEGLSKEYIVNGTGVASEIVALAQRVSTAAGMKCSIYGTAAALAKLPEIKGETAATDIYGVGYYQNFRGYKCYALDQIFVEGSEKEYILKDDELMFIANDGDKPIKLFIVGRGYFAVDDPLLNGDHSQNIAYGQKSGVAAIFSGRIGKYTFDNA